MLTSFRFPAQKLVGGDARVPSLLYYDRSGNVRAAGYEALTESTIKIAPIEGWVKAEWLVLFRVKASVELIHEVQVETSPLPKAFSIIYWSG